MDSGAHRDSLVLAAALTGHREPARHAHLSPAALLHAPSLGFTHPASEV